MPMNVVFPSLLCTIPYVFTHYSLCFGRKTDTFAGEGRRLGTAQERQTAAVDTQINTEEIPNTIPPVQYDPNLTEDDRERIRAERAAAAEARLKKQTGGVTAKQKKSTTETQPLKGPNSEPLMRWTAK